MITNPEQLARVKLQVADIAYWLAEFRADPKLPPGLSEEAVQLFITCAETCIAELHQEIDNYLAARRKK